MQMLLDDGILEAKDFESLTPGKSFVWVAKMQPLFKTYNGSFGVVVDDSGYKQHYIKGCSPLVYKPLKLTYVGMFSAKGTNDKIMVLTANDSWLRSDTYVVNFPGGYRTNNKIELNSDFLYAIADGKTIIDVDKLALTEANCYELCRYFNTQRSMRYLDHGLNLLREGKYYRETLKSMLKQLDEAEHAEYMVDPKEQLEKDLTQVLHKQKN